MDQDRNRTMGFHILTALMGAAAVLCFSVSPLHADTVVFRAGNSLNGLVERQGATLQITLELGGSTIIDPNQIATVQYRFPEQQEGDALPDYLAISKALKGIADFDELTKDLAPLVDRGARFPAQLEPALQERIDLFSGRNQESIRRLVENTFKTQCTRARYLLEQAPAECILEDTEGVFEVLPRLATLYRIYLLTNPQYLPVDLRGSIGFTGLRLANHWMDSIPREAGLASQGIGQWAAAWLEAESIESVPEAWNRTQDFLRLLPLDRPLQPAESLKLEFRLYERAFQAKGLPLPEHFDPDQAQAWVRLLSAETAYAWRLAGRQNESLDKETRQAYASRLIDLLRPKWSIEQHPDYTGLDKAGRAFRTRIDQLVLHDCRILLDAGFRSASPEYNPLRLLPGIEKGIGPFEKQS